MKTIKKLLPYVLFFTFIMIVLYAQEALKVNSAGNVGIGVSNPTDKLEVAGRIKDVTGYVAPVGTVTAYVGATAPTGWLLCDGKTVGDSSSGANYSGNMYKELYDKLLGTFGGTYNWAGHNTVQLPDLRGIFLRGAGTNAKLTDPNYPVYTGELGRYTADQMQGHRHYSGYNTESICGGLFGYVTRESSSQRYDMDNSEHTANKSSLDSDPYTDGTNGTTRYGVETRPANCGVYYIIKY